MQIQDRAPGAGLNGPRGVAELAAQYGITRLLSEAGDVASVRSAVLRCVCEQLGWQAGAWWDVEGAEVRCVAFWPDDGSKASFREATLTSRFAPGVGLPGRVVRSGLSQYIADVVADANFPRAAAAAADGLTSAFAVPIKARASTIGVIEFFAHQRREATQELLQAMTTVGGQLGLFIERMRAEEELRASEERYRRLVEASPEAIAVHQDGRFVFVNPAMVEMLGATVAEELLGREVLDFIHVDYRPLVKERIRRVLEEHSTADLIEEKFVRLDGRVIDVEVMAIWTEFEGRPAYQLMARDITARKRAEAESREAGERYRGLFANAVFGVFRTTPDGRFLDANQALASMFGYASPQQLMGEVSDISAQIHTDPARRAEFSRRLESEGSVSGFEALARRRDGSTISIALSGRTVTDETGAIVAYEGIVEDVTLRRQAEEQLREQKRVLETIEQVGASIASELELDRIVQAVTDAATALTGAQFGAFFYNQQDTNGDWHTLHTLSGADKSGFSELPMPNTPLFDDTFSGASIVRCDDIQKDSLYGQIEPYFRVPPGDLPVRSYLAVPVFSRSGGIAGGLFLGHESPGVFTERHEALAAGIARWAGIAVDNATVFAESRRMQEELRRANESKDEFLGLVSHELRTPITTIYGGARLLQSRGELLPEERKEGVLADIEAESERLYRLVEDLLALARLELGASAALHPISLTRVAEKLLADFARRRPGREIESDIPADLPPIEGEETYVQQVLRNLLSNADKYSPQDALIEVRARAEEDEVVVEVLDRGPGIEAQELERIFERFYRSEKTARQASGLGIGLTVCQRLIEAQNGRLWGEAREGGGLRMAFAVPVAREMTSDQ
jgi:PAS domain S-box-containing protein